MSVVRDKFCRFMEPDHTACGVSRVGREAGPKPRNALMMSKEWLHASEVLHRCCNPVDMVLPYRHDFRIKGGGLKTSR